MAPMEKFIKDLCAEIETLDPDWEHCPTCGSVIPYLKNNMNKGGIYATKVRVRVLLKELRDKDLTKYNIYNTRFKLL